MAKKKTPPPAPKSGGKKPKLPWLDPTTKTTRVCKCGAVNWGTSPTCWKCS